MTARTLGQLRMMLKELESLPDHTPILVPIRDHSYRESSLTQTTVLFDRPSRSFSQDIGPGSVGEEVEDLGVRIEAIVAS